MISFFGLCSDFRGGAAGCFGNAFGITFGIFKKLLFEVTPLRYALSTVEVEKPEWQAIPHVFGSSTSTGDHLVFLMLDLFEIHHVEDF